MIFRLAYRIHHYIEFLEGDNIRYGNKKTKEKEETD